MWKTKLMVMGFLWSIYVVFTAIYFPLVNIHCLILSIFLLSLTSWLYGTTVGLLALFTHMIYHAYLTSFLYADVVMYEEAKATGNGIAIAAIYLVGSLRNTHKKINGLRSSLETQVIEKTTELNRLTSQIIEEDEEVRIKLGQDIHDGLGQYLTGILLYSNSLAETLHRENSPSTQQARALSDQAQKALHLARKVSRTLFPIRISETGLDTALDELVSYFGDTSDMQFTVRMDGCQKHLPSNMTLHVYRIVYEAILHALHHQARPHRFYISLLAEDAGLRLRITYDGAMAKQGIENNTPIDLMRYRANQIQGHLVLQTQDDTTEINCLMPHHQHPIEPDESTPHAQSR